MALRKKAQSISKNQIRSGQVLEISYTSADDSTDTSMILVIDPDYKGKLHAIKLTNLSEIDMENLIYEIRSVTGGRRTVEEVDKIMMYENFKNTRYGVTRPYRTYLKDNIKSIKRITLGQATDPETKKLKERSSWLYGIEHLKFVYVNSNDLDALAKELDSVNGKIYFEGFDSPEEPVVSLLNLLRGKNNWTSKSWDTPLTPEQSLVLDLFGGEFSAIKKQIGDSTDTLMNTLLNTTSQWTSGNYKVTRELILNVCGLGNLDTTVLDQPYNVDNFRKFQTNGLKVAFDLGNNNPLELLQKDANTVRDIHLIKMMRSNPGIYFAGWGHIELVETLLRNGI